jgi:repressor LexA
MTPSRDTITKCGVLMLTPRQHAAFEFIAGFIDGRGYAPSYEEIRRHLGVRSLNAVAKLVAQLRRRGALAEAPFNAKRSLTPVARRSTRARASSPSTLPLLGLIAAGRPIEAIENPEPIEVPESLLGPGERYALQVRGDSMIEDGIRDGDLILVRRSARAENGQTVVAVVDGEATLKRFFRRGAQVELRPANAALSSMRWPAARVEIRGVLVGLLRRYS